MEGCDYCGGTLLKPVRRALDKDKAVVGDEPMHGAEDRPTQQMELYTDTWFVEKVEDGSGSAVRQVEDCDEKVIYDAPVEGDIRQRHDEVHDVTGRPSRYGEIETDIKNVKSKDNETDKEKAKERVNKRWLDSSLNK